MRPNVGTPRGIPSARGMGRVLVVGLVGAMLALAMDLAGPVRGALADGCSTVGTTTTCTYTGADTTAKLIVPSGVTTVGVTAIGASGQPGGAGSNNAGICTKVTGSPGGAGGQAAKVMGSLTVTANEALSIVVGSVTYAMHGGSGGPVTIAGGSCGNDEGGAGGNGGGASYVSTVIGSTTTYLAVASGGGGGGGGGDNTGGCSPGAKGGDRDQNGGDRIGLYCTTPFTVGGGGGADATSDGNGTNGSQGSFGGIGSGGGGAGGLNGGDGGAGGLADGGAGGGGGGSMVPSGGTVTTVSSSPTPEVILSYTLDTTAPTTTIGLTPVSPNGGNGWYASSVGVTISATDPDDTVAQTRCVLDPGTVPATFDDLPVAACSLSSVGTDGQHTIYAASKDSFGNKESVRSAGFKIDATSPTTTISLSPASPNGGNGWYTSSVGVTISGDDGSGSGIAETRCAVNPGTTPATFDDLPSGSCSLTSVSADGAYTLYAASEDLAGNKQPGVSSSTFMIDGTPPKTTISFSPASPNGSNNWYTSSVGVSISGDDGGGSGVVETRCVLDPGSVPATFDDLPSGSCSLTDVSTDLQHTIYAASEDAAGNKEPVRSAGVNIDATPPTTTISLSPASPNGSNGWYTSAVGVTVTGDDGSGSGIAQTRCALDPATAPTTFDDLPSGSCSLSSVSTDVASHTVYAASEDLAGNKESVRSSSFKIDQTAPSLAPTLSSNPVSLNQSGVTASPNATDSTSGVATSSCGAVDTSTPGDHTVTCNATDNAGNTSSVTVHYTVEYKIVGFFSPAPGSKWKVGQTVPIKVALTDANGVRIADADAAALASACRVTFSATGVQATSGTACMKYDSSTHQFIYSWKLARSKGGVDTITVQVTYPPTATKTTRSEQITITT